MHIGFKRKKQRILALMLAIMLVAGMLPSVSFAEKSESSTGTAQISVQEGKLPRASAPQQGSATEADSKLQRAGTPDAGSTSDDEDGSTEDGTTTEDESTTTGYVVTVKDADGNAIKGASVEYEVIKVTWTGGSFSETTVVETTETETDKNGNAVLEKLNGQENIIGTGVYLRLKVTSEGYAEYCNYDNNNKGQYITSTTSKTDVNLREAYIVTVVDSEDNALSDAQVEYAVVNATDETVVNGTAQVKDGKAELTRLADEKGKINNQEGLFLNLKVTKSGYYNKDISEPINKVSGTKSVTMTPMYAVVVKNTSNSALVGAMVDYKVVKVTESVDGSTTSEAVQGTSGSKDTDGTGKAVLTNLADMESVIGSVPSTTKLYLQLTVTKDGYADFCNYGDENAVYGDAIVDIGSITGTKEMKLDEAYTVTVKVNGDGTVTTVNGGNEVTTQKDSEGKITVKKSADNIFSIKATPDKGYRLEKFEKQTSNGWSDEKTFNVNDAKYEFSEQITANTTYTATFAPNRYQVSFEKTGDDGNCEVSMKIINREGWERLSTPQAGKQDVVYGEKVYFSIKSSVDYKFIGITKSDDTEIECPPKGTDVYESDPILCEEDMDFMVEFSEVASVFADPENPFEMEGHYTIESDKDLVRTISGSGGETVYVFPKETNIILKPDGTNYNLVKYIKSDTEQYDAQKAIPNGTKLDHIYLGRLVSFYGWLWIDEKSKVSVDCGMKMEFVLDDKAPETNIVLPATANGYYNQDVNFTVNVAEPEEGKCSGIASVKYWIVSNGKTTKEKTTLYEYKTGAEILDTFNKTVKIDAAANNYDGVKIYVEVTDRAGNVYTNEQDPTIINIDGLQPQVSLTYDNNNNYKHSEYFNAARTATIKVTERKNFDHAKATEGIVITAKDVNNQDVAGAYTISEWSTQENSENDNLTTHTATITFSADANYTLAMSFQDIAGNSNAPIETGDSVAPYAFTVDTKAPTGTLTAKSKEGRSSTWEKLITDLKFGYYSKAKITLSGTSADETSPILSVQYYKQVQAAGAGEMKALSSADLDKITDWKDFKEFSVSKDEKFVVYLKITDSAGNYAYISTDGLIVDEHAPVKEVFEPKVTVEPEQPVNGYYNKDVTVKLKVEDPEINGTYTGLKEISYKVYNESVSKTEPTQEETLLSFAVKNPAQSDLVQKWDGKIKVDSSKNNSNHVVVEVYAEDNAGNSVTYTKKLKIDTTVPDVNIKYSNNSAVGGSYFNAGRTATIEVTERNFDINDMKIKITNTDGAAPKVSDWKQTKGTGNGDNTKWTATVNYAQDGDYTFDIAYKDRAGNKAAVKYAGGTVAAEEFTIDGTKPVINVSYDNNNVHNGEYYNTARRATVSITEHNFDPQKVETTISATENGATVAAPAISGWSTNGDVHTATISYANDARYTFDISVTDMAGNAAGDFAEQSFYVDQTAPELQITGVKDQSANAGDVIPVVTYSDSNFDADALHIELTGANRKEVKPDGAYSNSSTGGSFTFKNFAKTQNVDDIYVLSATLTDRAGNTVSDEVTFSVNRFGSTYDFSDRTEQINGSYIQASEDIVVVETNPTKLTDIKVTLFQNNETLQLTEGQDYDIRQTGGNGQWYHYTYTVHKDVFEEDGIYKLVLHSKDGAENISENILETKDAEISFGVDKTKPNIVVANLDSKQTYALDNMTVIMSASDNLKLTEVMVYLDDSLHAEWKDESLETMLDQSGDLTFDIPGTSNHAHKVKIVCRDAAGNEAVQEITGFYVTTNLWVRYFNNKPLFYGSILAMAAALGFIVFIVVKRRKKEEE